MGATTNTPPVPRALGLLVRRFHDVPVEATNIIADSAPIYGSRAVALLVATEVLIRQKRPIRLRYQIKKSGKTITMSYKLLPRAVELIDKLTPRYGTRGRVIEACAMEVGKITGQTMSKPKARR